MFIKANILNQMNSADFQSDSSEEIKNLAQRIDAGEQGRFRHFSREWLSERNGNSDISWIKEETGSSNGTHSEPIALLQRAMDELELVFEDVHSVMSKLEEEIKS